MNLIKYLRFRVALLGGRLWLRKIKWVGRPRNDRPGMVSMRLCPDFLYYAKKPPLTIVVTGTNGKTTISGMLADALTARGLKVAYNDWGANHHAGVARVLLECLTWTNRCRMDAAIIELDELISPEDMPALKPNFIVVNNLARDSMLRNGHPDFIRSRLEMALDSSPESVAILNGDDPISSTLGQKNPHVYFGIYPHGDVPTPTYGNDYPICDVCGAVANYEYRLYRHLGQVRCPKCGKTSPKRDFYVENVDLDAGTMTVRDPETTAIYPLANLSMHNVANEAAVVTLLRTMGIPADELTDLVKHCAILPSRETHTQVGKVEVITRIAKGQNPTAVNTVLWDLQKDTSPKELVMVLDEHYSSPLKSETIAWIYDVDYSYLNRPWVRRIIVGGARYLDHKLRLLLAGVPEEKIICVPDELETAKYVNAEGVEKIVVLHDVNAITRGHKVRDAIIERIGGAV